MGFLKILAIVGVVFAVGFYYVTRPKEVSKNVFEPSTLSSLLAVPATSDYDGVKIAKKSKGGKILVLMTEEELLKMTNGKNFNTGNHPTETLVPLLHLLEANFSASVFTPTGKSVKIEEWAFPRKDKAVMDLSEAFRDQFSKPGKFSDISESLSEYTALFLPGGHGALSILDQKEPTKVLGRVLRTAMKQKKVIVTLCHGPALLLANPEIFKDFKIVSFPDKWDEYVSPVIGYLPGSMPWFLGKRLVENGLNVLNVDAWVPDGSVHQDRNLLTGDSPAAANALGRLALKVLLKE